VDSGASDMSIPADIVSTLIRTKTITDQDFLGQQTHILADGPVSNLVGHKSNQPLPLMPIEIESDGSTLNHDRIID
jgi:hypothetical protein